MRLICHKCTNYFLLRNFFLLFLHYLSLIYPLSIPYLSLIYPLSIPYLPLIYPLSIPYLSLIYPLSIPYLSLIYPPRWRKLAACVQFKIQNSKFKIQNSKFRIVFHRTFSEGKSASWRSRVCEACAARTIYKFYL